MVARRSKVLVAMSGGVDSSVAAALLVQAGYEVVGCFMRLGSPGETLDTLLPDNEQACELDRAASSNKPVKIGHQGCCSINDAADARTVAAQLGIPFYVSNFKKDFGRIIDYFVDEYARGRTPNPCVRCNDWLKFGKLHEYAMQIGADFVASGHYARIEPALASGSQAASSPRLCRGLDDDKDQSYVLFGVPRSHLSRMLLPIGAMHKSRVRELAREFGLPVFNKPDSQEICFVPDNDYAGLVERRRPELVRTGEIRDESGAVLGTHAGQHHYTIGQRRGLSVSLGHPVYVVGKDAQANTVTVGTRDRLLVSSCTAAEANWLIDLQDLPTADDPMSPSTPGRSVFAKYRYNSDPVPARIWLLPDAIGSPAPSGRTGRFHVLFDAPQTAVAPGQAVVLYDAAHPDWVIGGGWIESVQPQAARHG